MRQIATTPKGADHPVKLLLTVDEACAMLSVGRTRLYSLVTRNEIFSVKVGGLRRIPVTALHDFVERLSDSQKAS
jgi:excisionase family DNA binding protein